MKTIPFTPGLLSERGPDSLAASRAADKHWHEYGPVVPPTATPTVATPRSSHTPGPWFIGVTPREIRCHDGAQGHTIAICGANLGLTDSESESRANARLIAAAPELLAALQIELAYWNNRALATADLSCDNPAVSEIATRRRAIRAAIAQAESHAD